MTHYGCHSKPRSDGYWARDLCPPIHRTQPPTDIWTWIPDTMSRDCRYDHQRDDPKCEGCTRIVK